MQTVPPPPAEYVGQARLFRSRIEDAELIAGTAIPKLVALVQRNARKGLPPPPMVATMWRREVPKAGQLYQTIAHRRTELTVEEVRLIATKFRFLDWRDSAHEPCVGLVQIVLHATKRDFSIKVNGIAEFSLHCLARRYERASDTSDVAICDDIRALVAEHDRLAFNGRDFDMPVKAGRWVGVITTIASQNGGKEDILAARTFLNF